MPVHIDHASLISPKGVLDSFCTVITDFWRERRPDPQLPPDSDPEACILSVDLPGALDNTASSCSSSGSHTIATEDYLSDDAQGVHNDLTTAISNLDKHRWNIPFVTPTRTSALAFLREDTPLIRNADPSNLPAGKKGYNSIESERKIGTLPVVEPLKPDPKSQEITPAKQHSTGNSTFGQTLFNTVAMLFGMGMMSEPLAFAYAGWGCGTLLLIFYGFLTCYTAKILARFIVADPKVRTYTDIGRKAFGDRSTYFISLVFCLELFTALVTLVTLYADSLETIAPTYSTGFYKLLGLIAFLPIVFLPLSWLSVTSVLGIGSSLLLISVILIDGLTKETAPGSIWDPLPSSFGISSFPKLGISFGLFMAGFSGHVAIPGLVQDMTDPSQFEKMIDIAYVIATVLYGIVGITGYRMFGNNVSEEFSQDLFATPGYNELLNKIALCALVITPVTKFGLAAHPMNIALENLLGLNPRSTHRDRGSDNRVPYKITFRKIASVIQRILVVFLVVAVSIAVPDFSSVLGFLGTAFAFLISVIGPIGAKIAIEKRCSRWDALMLVIGVTMASWGTFSVVYTQNSSTPR